LYYYFENFANFHNVLIITRRGLDRPYGDRVSATSRVARDATQITRQFVKPVGDEHKQQIRPDQIQIVVRLAVDEYFPSARAFVRLFFPHGLYSFFEKIVTCSEWHGRGQFHVTVDFEKVFGGRHIVQLLDVHSPIRVFRAEVFVPKCPVKR